MARPATAEDAAWIVKLDRLLWGDDFLTVGAIEVAVEKQEVFVAGNKAAYCYYQVHGGRVYIVAMGCRSYEFAPELVAAIRASREKAATEKIFTHLVPSAVPMGVLWAMNSFDLKPVREGENSDLPGVELKYDLRERGYWLYQT